MQACTLLVELACTHVVRHIHCHMLIAASILDLVKELVNAEVKALLKPVEAKTLTGCLVLQCLDGRDLAVFHLKH